MPRRLALPSLPFSSLKRTDTCSHFALQPSGSRERLEGQSGEGHGDKVGRQQRWRSGVQLVAAPPRWCRARAPVLFLGLASSNVRAGARLEHLMAWLCPVSPGSPLGWRRHWGWALLSPDVWGKEIELVLGGSRCTGMAKLHPRVSSMPT